MGKTLILSDIHFCKKSSTCNTAEQLRQLWQGCDLLILNGDTTEEHGLRTAEESRIQTKRLIKLAKQDGVQTTLICGNHDPEYEPNHVWICGNRLLVMHGHVAFSGVAPWSWRSRYIAAARKKYLEETGDGFEQQLSAICRSSVDAATGKFKSHRPSTFQFLLLIIPSIMHVLLGWLTFPTRIHRWAKTYAPATKFIVTGHTHHAGIWRREDRVIINTGCFGFPSHPRAVLIDECKLTVYKLQKKKNIYSLGRIFASWNLR
jgi:predicted phosphodiesterase